MSRPETDFWERAQPTNILCGWCVERGQLTPLHMIPSKNGMCPICDKPDISNAYVPDMRWPVNV